jgi:hypothetical protein
MFGRRYVPKWMGGWCLKKEWHQGKKRKNKVDAEEIDRVLCAFAVAPWWWFGHTRDLRVVVVVSCYHLHLDSSGHSKGGSKSKIQ